MIEEARVAIEEAPVVIGEACVVIGEARVAIREAHVTIRESRITIEEARVTIGDGSPALGWGPALGHIPTSPAPTLTVPPCPPRHGSAGLQLPDQRADGAPLPAGRLVPAGGGQRDRLPRRAPHRAGRGGRVGARPRHPHPRLARQWRRRG